MSEVIRQTPDIQFDGTFSCVPSNSINCEPFCNSWKAHLTCNPLSFDRKRRRAIQMHYGKHSQSYPPVQSYVMYVRLGNRTRNVIKEFYPDILYIKMLGFCLFLFVCLSELIEELASRRDTKIGM